MAASSFQQARILIVEPSSDARRALAEIVRAEGHSPLQAADGYEALEILRQGQVNLAILDADSGEPTGAEILEQCNRLGVSVPIVLAAPSWNVRRAIAAVKAGARDYLAKPYNVNEVAEVLRGALDPHHSVKPDSDTHTQKLEAIGRLAGGIVHDFNNLLTVILGYSDLLRTVLPEAAAEREYAHEISKAAQQGAALTAQLLAFSRTQVVEPVVLDLNDVIRRGESLLRRSIGDHIELSLQLEPDVAAIRADATQINQVIANLALNARDAMPDGGTIAIHTQTIELPPNPFTKESVLGNTHSSEGGRGSLNFIPPNSFDLDWDPGKSHSGEAGPSRLPPEGARGSFDSAESGAQSPERGADDQLGDLLSALRAPLPPGRYTVLTVHDTGCGMDGPTRSRLFELFFTTKRHGNGLGLATVQNIVRQWNGYITVASEPGQGSTFTIYFPCAPACGFALAPSPAVALSGDETIILLEEELPVRNLIRLTLECNGYTVLDAHSAADVLYLASDYRGPIHLLISNLLPEGATAPDLAKRALLARPGLKILFITGHSNAELTGQALQQGHLVLHKPFPPETLLAKVREALLQREVRNVG